MPATCSQEPHNRIFASPRSLPLCFDRILAECGRRNPVRPGQGLARSLHGLFLTPAFAGNSPDTGCNGARARETDHP